MSFTLSNKKPIKVYWNKALPEACLIAIKSFNNDLGQIFRKIEPTEDEHVADFVLNISNFGSIEGYKISICDKQVTITGNDDLGLIFGLYTFLEKYLNVPPFYKFVRIKLSKIKEITINNENIVESPSTRFRGWFINDEDLLGDFKSKGKRRIKYMFYNKIISPKMMEIVCETALRHKINLIIPSTFIDIMEPNEYNLVKICSKMGLYVSQHHIEPLGVSKFGFSNYVKDHNLGSDVYSFVTNKNNLKIVWEAYAKKWAEFPRIIWQLGLRSGLDRPVWDTEKNVGNTAKERGALISDAINTQYDIISKNYPYEIISTSTLWMEGADLLKSGNLIIPKETIVVLSDIGISSLFGDDFFKVKRESDKKYGFYYHAAYFHVGPHLAEGLIPEKMDYCFKLAKEYKNDYYTILNVANVKDLLLSIYINSKLAFNEKSNIEEIYEQYSKLFFKKDNSGFTNAIKDYYSSLGDIGDDIYKRFCDKNNFSYHKFEKVNFPLVNFNDGIFRSYQWSYSFEDRLNIRSDKLLNMCEKSLELAKKANKEFLSLLKCVSSNLIDDYKQRFVFQSEYICYAYETLIYLDYGARSFLSHDKESMIKNYQLAINSIDKILLSRKKYFTHYFENWFKGDTKINIQGLKDNLINELNALLSKIESSN